MQQFDKHRFFLEITSLFNSGIRQYGCNSDKSWQVKS